MEFRASWLTDFRVRLRGVWSFGLPAGFRLVQFRGVKGSGFCFYSPLKGFRVWSSGLPGHRGLRALGFQGFGPRVSSCFGAAGQIHPGFKGLGFIG